jgi:hypothetical protein
MKMSNDAQDVGYVIFGDPEGSYDLQAVENAARVAGIPDHLVHAIRPKSAFIRAAKELAKQGYFKSDFKKSIRNDESALTFAFVVQRAGYNVDNADFGVEALVKFHKKKQWIEVLEAPPNFSAQEVAEQAMNLYRQAVSTWTCADVNYLVKRYVSRYARKIKLRSGASFLPYHAADMAKALQMFYGRLDVSFYVFPVGHSSDCVLNITKAIVEDIKKNMTDLTQEISGLKREGKLTEAASQTRLAELQTALRQYRDLAQSVQIDLGKLVADAGETAQILAYAAHPVDALIALVQGGERVPEVLCQLHESDPRGNELMALIQAQAHDAPLPEFVAPETEMLVQNSENSNVNLPIMEYTVEKGA